MDTDATIRLGIFLSVLLLMMLLELLLPRRRVQAHRPTRWTANLGIQVINGLVLRLIVPAGAAGIAHYYADRGIGLFAGQSQWWVWLICLAAMDLAIYAQHVFSHHFPPLWRLHRMHHSDTHIDATTALRFHPLEIALSMVWKAVVLAVLGAPVGAVLLFEVLLNACAVFNHANFRLPLGVDKILRLVIVTPDMHRVHHSVYVDETNSNYGFNMPWWDRLFGTYTAQPRDGHDHMQIGIESFRALREQRLDRLLLQPLRVQ